MKAKKTFSRRGQLFREGEAIPEGVLPESAIPLLIAEGWIEAEIKVEAIPEAPKKATRERRKK
jgi:hypothetical protein